MAILLLLLLFIKPVDYLTKYKMNSFATIFCNNILQGLAAVIIVIQVRYHPAAKEYFIDSYNL